MLTDFVLVLHRQHDYLHILEMVFITPEMEPLSENYEACYKLNSTCGVDFEVLKRLVSTLIGFKWFGDQILKISNKLQSIHAI